MKRSIVSPEEGVRSIRELRGNVQAITKLGKEAQILLYRDQEVSNMAMLECMALLHVDKVSFR